MGGLELAAIAFVLLLLVRPSSAPSGGLVVKNDYVGCYSDPLQLDDDPPLLRRGVTVQPAGDAQGDLVPITIPAGTPVFSLSGPYAAHAPIDYSATWWTPRRNLQ